jgi:hypothetical protein
VCGLSARAVFAVSRHLECLSRARVGVASRALRCPGPLLTLCRHCCTKSEYACQFAARKVSRRANAVAASPCCCAATDSGASAHAASTSPCTCRHAASKAAAVWKGRLHPPQETSCTAHARLSPWTGWPQPGSTLWRMQPGGGSGCTAGRAAAPSSRTETVWQRGRRCTRQQHTGGRRHARLYSCGSASMLSPQHTPTTRRHACCHSPTPTSLPAGCSSPPGML